ncbi:response regulator [Marinithermus hydrothermalis]|uniref:Response regulator receiver protein n=1 Tax=Marinithermus hydrothermalis (strain DSM 14884 / JCM 11576 / T1) TaxID=869210 RepID=F2NPN0_MARHT|nr:response regulator [Marinithermus hydrothermalis]AEB12531.1 response regulator receiver protein [Marinithermus hydrothermalis DSM 14884]
MRVLVVEDDPGMIRFLEVILTGMGCGVDVARDGREALEYLKGHTPDLILLDVMLPELDGLGLLTRIRQVRRLQEVPVLVLTADVSSSTALQARMLKADAFLTKPVTSQELRRTVRELLAARGGVLLPGGVRVGSVEEARPYFAAALGDEVAFRQAWRKAETREARLAELERQGWLEALERLVPRPEVDVYDRLGHVAYGWPLLARKARAERARAQLEAFAEKERAVAEALLAVYAEKGVQAMERLDTLDRPALRPLGGERAVVQALGGLRAYLEFLDRLAAVIYAD